MEHKGKPEPHGNENRKHSPDASSVSGASGMKVKEERNLSPNERQQRYRDLAQQARKDAANTADSETRASFLRLAQGWESLAAQLEKTRPPD